MESATVEHWLPCRTSDAAHPCNNSEGQVRLTAAKGDTLRRERVRYAMGVGGSFVVVTAGDWCTLGDRRNIGDDGISGCPLARGIFCLVITSRIFVRGVSTLGGGGTCAGGVTKVESPLEVASPFLMELAAIWGVDDLGVVALGVEAMSGGPSWKRVLAA